MSHFTRVKVRIRSREHLIAALKNLGYRVKEDADVRGWRGNTTRADVVVRMADGYDIGFVRNSRGEDYQAVADWTMSGTDQEQFVNSVQQEYALVSAEAAARKSGWVDLRRERQKDGSVLLIGRRMPGPRSGF